MSMRLRNRASSDTAPRALRIRPDRGSTGSGANPCASSDASTPRPVDRGETIADRVGDGRHRFRLSPPLLPSCPPLPARSCLPFLPEQRLLPLDAPAIAALAARRRHDAMTGDRQRDRVGRTGARDGAHRPRPADRRRHLRRTCASRRTESPRAPATPATGTPSPARRAADRAAAGGRPGARGSRSSIARARRRRRRSSRPDTRASARASAPRRTSPSRPRRRRATSPPRAGVPARRSPNRRSRSRSACRRRRGGRSTAPSRASARRARRSGCSIRSRRRASRR